MSNRSKTLVWTAVEWPFWKARMADSWPLNPTFSKSQRFVTRIALLSNGFSPIESKINENKKERTAEPNRPVLRLATKVDSIWELLKCRLPSWLCPLCWLSSAWGRSILIFHLLAWFSIYFAKSPDIRTLCTQICRSGCRSCQVTTNREPFHPLSQRWSTFLPRRIRWSIILLDLLCHSIEFDQQCWFFT